jgi:hypothetical protein
MATMIGRRANVPMPSPDSRRATVRVETEGSVYEGRIWVPSATCRVADVLADDRQFLSLTEVRVNDGEQREAYMALSKSVIRTLRILDDVAPVDASRGVRAQAP